ncbi:MAG TPA: 3-methylaspartate ammonia-lyase, partial [Tetragenococcus sp.]|nr:3-methylaspartate ammonia-lyase [Tetragenococcus sp.]
ASKAMPHTVAAHTMYEKSSALNLPGPGGVLNLEECEFTAETDRITRISGSRFIKDDGYSVKLEGAKVVGYRSITVMGLRDPILIAQVDEALTYVKAETEKELPEECAQSQIIFHPYGKNATMKNLESLTNEAGHEMCVIAEVASPTQEMAQLVVNRIRTTLLHYGYPGRVATSGNIGMPFTPLEIPLGKVCQFNVYHLLQIDDPVRQFPVTVQEVGK